MLPRMELTLSTMQILIGLFIRALNKRGEKYGRKNETGSNDGIKKG